MKSRYESGDPRQGCNQSCGGGALGWHGWQLDFFPRLLDMHSSSDSVWTPLCAFSCLFPCVWVGLGLEWRKRFVRVGCGVKRGKQEGRVLGGGLCGAIAVCYLVADAFADGVRGSDCTLRVLEERGVPGPTTCGCARPGHAPNVGVLW